MSRLGNKLGGKENQFKLATGLQQTTAAAYYSHFTKYLDNLIYRIVSRFIIALLSFITLLQFYLILLYLSYHCVFRLSSKLLL